MGERTYLMKNDKFVIGTETWLVLQKIDQYSLIIKLNTNKMHVKKIKTEDIVYKIIRGEVTLELSQNSSKKVVDINALPLSLLKKYDQLKQIFEYLSENYSGLEWLLDRDEKSTAINKVVKRFSISDDTVRRRILAYLQGGMMISALIPKYSNCGAKLRVYTDKKTGPKGNSIMIRDEKMEKIFSIMTSRYMVRGAKIPYTKLYNEMILEFYSDEKSIGGEIKYFPYPVTLRPTLKQLKHWIKTHTDEVERQFRSQGKKSARNNFRPLFSDTIAYLDVKAIGSRYEMDEMETDFYLVNRIDRYKPIGRAIVYFIVDVYSRAIVSCGIGLDNNSWSGAEIALLNLVENKKEFCTQYGININDSDWPMKEAIPSSIIVDNGAEYLSDSFVNLASEVGIGIDFVPPQMGSFKGNVEQKFRQMNLLLKDNLPGEIEKEKYGQPHIRKASLDIYQFSQAVIHFILDYNNSPMDNYPDSKDMFEKHLILTPINIWNYSLNRNNELTFVSDVECYKYSLLKRDIASITRYGIYYKSRYFICCDIDWLGREASKAALNGYRKNKLQIRYDMRNPDFIYYEKDGIWDKAYLNSPEVINNINSEVHLPIKDKTSNSKYAGLTEPEIEDIINTKKNQNINNTEIKLKNNINTEYKINNIKKEALSSHNSANDIHGIKINRSNEQQQLYKERHIFVDEGGIINHTEETDENSISDDIIEKIDLKSMTRIEKIRWVGQHKNNNMSAD